MKVLVVGGSGFIGSHIVDRLLAHGHSVRVFDRQAETFRGPLCGVDYRFGDFADRMALVEALTGVEAVYHLVSTTLPGTADLDPKTDIQDNLIGAINLFESMHALGVHRILFLSSGGTVYGIPEMASIPETHPLRPISSYGIVKASIEHYLEMYRRTRGISPIIVRASNPFGPRQAHSGVQGVISTFLRRVLVGEPIEIWGDGSVVRDYFYVSDLAEFCARAGTGRREGAYNVGSGRGMSINEIVEAVRKVTGLDFETVYKPGRTTDVPRSVLDCSRAKNDFEWECEADFESALRKTWDWLKVHV
jgi:UDP-glucose 4-epimerase